MKIIKQSFILTMISALVMMCFSPDTTVRAETVNINEIQLNENIYNSTVEGKQTVQDTTEVVSEDGKVIQTINSSTTKDVTKNPDTKSIIITLTTTIKTLDADGKQIDNSTEVEKIEINNNGDVYLNEQKASDRELNAEITAEEVLEKEFSTFAASGGKSWLTYYEDRGSKWYLKSYEKPSNAFLDGSSGPARVRYPKSLTSKVSNFNALARSVAAERNDIVANSATLMGALGVGALTWGTIIGALTAAGTAGKAAVSIYSSSSSGKSYMKQAWSQINSIN